jgi:hypothetical protein
MLDACSMLRVYVARQHRTARTERKKETAHLRVEHRGGEARGRGLLSLGGFGLTLLPSLGFMRLRATSDLRAACPEKKKNLRTSKTFLSSSSSFATASSPGSVASKRR